MGGKADTSATDARQTAWGCCRRHIADHWHGRLPLVSSFWLDLVALSVLAWQAAAVARRSVDVDSWPLLSLALVAFGLYWFVVYPWQVVGVVRAARHNIRGDLMLAPVAPLAAALMVVMAIPQGVELTRVTQLLLDDGSASQAGVVAPQPRSYTLELAAGGTLIWLRGEFDFGVTGELRDQLESNPGVVGVILDSDGGPVYEARGVGKAILDHRLDTYSLHGCNSACTTAFIAGTRRWLAPGARLGFHRYYVSGHSTLFIDVDEEQRADLAFYAGRGIAPEFLKTLFDKPHDDIWYPSLETLIAAGVVHGTLDAASVARLEDRR